MQLADIGWREERRGTYPGKADFVAQVVEATDAILGVFEIVILDETKTVTKVSSAW